MRLKALQQLKNPIKAANVVGLRYVTDNAPGIRREKSGDDFLYRSVSGKIVRAPATLNRIQRLAIPPAWTDVWICRDANGHLQATGRDVRGRKQHRYHSHWREVRDDAKYGRLILFARALPKIRQRVSRDLKLSGLPRNRVLATIVRLLETSLIRVGNDEYARHNESFGLTTMRDRHVQVNGSALQFHFRGKGGKQHSVDIRDQRLAKIVKSCQELPGQELFQYVDDDGKRQDVKSSDVNDYLREVSGEDFTAKDFRTWAGTVLAAMALQEFSQFDSEAQAKKNVGQAIESVAKSLGNTPAICRKCYVHPEILNAYMSNELLETLKARAESKLSKSLKRLRPEEAAVLAFLQKHLAEQEEGLLGTMKKALRQFPKRRNSIAHSRSARPRYKDAPRSFRRRRGE
jgi:DNA topoisomerase-1